MLLSSAACCSPHVSPTPSLPRLAAARASSSSYSGAGCPRLTLAPADIPPLLMHDLSVNDVPARDSGLHAIWAFAGDTTRFIYKNNVTEFIEDAHATAELPTSFYGHLVRAPRAKSRVLEMKLSAHAPAFTADLAAFNGRPGLQQGSRLNVHTPEGCYNRRHV